MSGGRRTPPATRQGARRPPAPAKPTAKQAAKPPASRVAAEQATRKPASRPLVKAALLPPEAARPRKLARDTVSATSARRFSAKVRARHRTQLLIVLAVVLALAGGGWLAVKSSWATVQNVSITGTHRIPPADIEAVAGSEVGHPLLFARTGDVEKRIAAMRLVRAVTVTRHFPSGLRVVVTEREPVAAVPDGKDVALVDPDGVIVERDPRPPAALPLVQVAAGTADAGSIRGCLAVLHGLPVALSSQLKSIGASSADGIHLELRSGATVQWGSGDQTALKARVLLALLPQHASHYDVRSPNTPAVVKK